MRLCLSPILFLLSSSLFAQPAMPLKSVRINPDSTLTFQLSRPSATKVTLSIENLGQPIEMSRDAAGLWTATSPPLVPEIYGYHFNVDGQAELDPQNADIRPNLVSPSSSVTLPGTPAQPWEPTAIPHGVVHHHLYTSHAGQNLPLGQEDFFVYTPPGYDATAHTQYPVLYLLHGWSDPAAGWVDVGKANLILDSLIASGKARPMIVVMPLGYGDLRFVQTGFEVWKDVPRVQANTKLFSQMLLTEILPQVESAYRVSKKREDRAIAGLSMGGLESLSIGLDNPKLFAWVGGFSAALAEIQPGRFASVTPKSADLRLLWIAVGASEKLLEPNRRLIAELKQQGLSVTAIETPGLHTWPVWRDNLVHFAPLLFQPK